VCVCVRACVRVCVCVCVSVWIDTINSLKVIPRPDIYRDSPSQSHTLFLCPTLSHTPQTHTQHHTHTHTPTHPHTHTHRRAHRHTHPPTPTQFQRYTL